MCHCSIYLKTDHAYYINIIFLEKIMKNIMLNLFTDPNSSTYPLVIHYNMQPLSSDINLVIALYICKYISYSHQKKYNHNLKFIYTFSINRLNICLY